jgi:hypothetical protein
MKAPYKFVRDECGNTRLEKYGDTNCLMAIFKEML